uniref:Uncharacterized protein n=1 Tax=Siphoviridae sp. ctKcB20 TaxID=2827568 RepID=A0A8S5LLU8_9CAUD|nr:MAG TPA: hypothetical protein [Siphoviridae sp. ctKcB20]
MRMRSIMDDGLILFIFLILWILVLFYEVKDNRL